MLLVFALVLCGAAIVAAGESLSMQDMVMYSKNLEDCKAAEMPTPNDLEILLNFSASIQNATPQGKCFMGCMMERAGFLLDGTIPRSAMEELIVKKMKPKDQPTALHYLAECEKDMVGISKDKCVAGVVVVECIRKFEAAMRT